MLALVCYLGVGLGYVGYSWWRFRRKLLAAHSTVPSWTPELTMAMTAAVLLWWVVLGYDLYQSVLERFRLHHESHRRHR